MEKASESNFGDWSASDSHLPAVRSWAVWEKDGSSKTWLRESDIGSPHWWVSSSLFSGVGISQIYEKDLMDSFSKPRGEVVLMLDRSNQRVGPLICLEKFRKCLKTRPFSLLTQLKTRSTSLFKKEQWTWEERSKTQWAPGFAFHLWNPVLLCP